MTSTSAGVRSSSSDQRDQGAVEELTEHAQELAEQAQERAQALADQARVRAYQEFEARSRVFADRASSTAEDLQGVAEHLRSQGRDASARAADEASERVSRLAGYLEGADADQLLHDLEALGRKRPWAMIVGGAAVGLAASRFLKASSAERYRGSGTASARGTASSGTSGRAAGSIAVRSAR